MLTAEIADRLDALGRRADALATKVAGLEKSVADALAENTALRQETARLAGWRLAVEGELTRLTAIVAILAAAHDDDPEVRACRAAAARSPLNGGQT